MQKKTQINHGKIHLQYQYDSSFFPRQTAVDCYDVIIHYAFKWNSIFDIFELVHMYYAFTNPPKA